MVRRRKKKPEVVASFAAYIDPTRADSTVSYKVVKSSTRLYGDVQLADCNRKIGWYFPGDSMSIEKIDNVIEILQGFRNEFVMAITARNKSKRKKSTRAR